MTNAAPDNAVPAWRDIFSRDYVPATVLVCLGVWLHAADSLIVATMLPAMIAEIGGGELVSWNVALYELGTIIMGVASGALALRFGVRVPMGAAAGLFAFGCALAAVAPAMWVVLVGRLIQGLGGGGLMALALRRRLRALPAPAGAAGDCRGLRRLGCIRVPRAADRRRLRGICHLALGFLVLRRPVRRHGAVDRGWR